MVTKSSSSDVPAPNSHESLAPRDVSESISDDALLRGFTLSLGASGRAEKTLSIYAKSVRALSQFALDRGLPGLSEMDRNVVRHWLTSLHQRNNKPATVSVRHRSVNRFFKWCVAEGERGDNPMDLIDPPRIPEEIQPYYQPAEVNSLLKAIGNGRTLRRRADHHALLCEAGPIGDHGQPLSH